MNVRAYYAAMYMIVNVIGMFTYYLIDTKC